MTQPNDKENTEASGVSSSDLLAPFPMIQKHLGFIERAHDRNDKQQLRISSDEIKDALGRIKNWCDLVEEHLADGPHPDEGGSYTSLELRRQYKRLFR